MSIKRKLDFTLKIPDFIAAIDDRIYAGAFDRQMPLPGNGNYLNPPNIYLGLTYKLTNNNETETIGSITYNIFKLKTNKIGFSSANYNIPAEQTVRNTLSFTFYKNPRSESDHMSRIERGFRRKILLFNKNDQGIFFENDTITKTYILNQDPENDDGYPFYRKLNFIVRINRGELDSKVYIGGGTIGNFNAHQLDYNTTTTDGNVSQYDKSIYVVNKENVEEKLIRYWMEGNSTKFSAGKNDVAFKVFMDGDEVKISQGTVSNDKNKITLALNENDAGLEWNNYNRSQGTVSNDNNENKITLALNEYDAGLKWNNYNRLKNVLDKRDENMNLINSDIDILLNGFITPTYNFKTSLGNRKSIDEGYTLSFDIIFESKDESKKKIPLRDTVVRVTTIEPADTAQDEIAISNKNYVPINNEINFNNIKKKEQISLRTIRDNEYSKDKYVGIKFEIIKNSAQIIGEKTKTVKLKIINTDVRPKYLFNVVNPKTVKEGQKISYSVYLTPFNKFIPYTFQVKTLDNHLLTTAKPNVNYTPDEQTYTVNNKNDNPKEIFIQTLNDKTYTENKNLRVEFKLLNWNTDNGQVENTTIRLTTTIININ